MNARQAGMALVNASGHFFNAATAVKDNLSSLEKLMQAGQHTIAAIKYDGRRYNGQARAFENYMHKSLAVIDLTRVCSSMYYFLSGHFINDLKKWNFAAALGSISYAAAHGIQAYLGVKELLRLPGALDEAKETSKEVLTSISNAFLIGGYLGEIAENIHTLVKSEASNVEAWLDLTAAVAGLALPILACCGVTFVPLLTTLGLISLLLTGASVVYKHYRKSEDELSQISPNFASNTNGMNVTLSPVGPIATRLKQEQSDALAHLSSNIGTFNELTAALNIFNRGKEWLHPCKDGKRFWEFSSAKAIMSKLFSAVRSLMDGTSWLASLGAIDGAFKENNVFKVVKNSLSLGSAALNLIEGSCKLGELQDLRQKLAFKNHKWEVLTQTLNVSSMPTAAAWSSLKERLQLYYHFKIQTEYDKAEQRPQKIERWEALKAALEEDITVEQPHNADRAVRAGYFQIKKEALLHKVAAKMARYTADSGERLFLEEQYQALGQANRSQVVSYKKALAGYKFSKEDVKYASACCTVAAEALKVAATIAAIAAIFFASFMGALPTLLALLSALMGGGRYFTAALYKGQQKPALDFAA